MRIELMLSRAWLVVCVSAFADIAVGAPMNLPFIPIGGSYVPVVNATAPIQSEYTFAGKDENGNDIYATDWVEVEPAEWLDSVDNAVSKPGSQPIRGLLAESGLQVIPTAPDGERIVNPAQGEVWDHLGTCHYAGEGNTTGTPATETTSSCIELIRAYWGPPNYGFTGSSQYFVPTMVGSCRTGSWHFNVNGTITGGFHANEDGCLDTNPDIPVPQPMPLTQGQAMELLQHPPPGQGESDLPEPLSRPITNNEFTQIINNNISNITNLSSTATSLTTIYETNNNPGELPNPDTSAPPGLPTGGESGSEDMSAFCEENPDVLACLEVDEELLTEFESEDAQALSIVDGLVSDVEGYLVDAETYRIGDGPVVGPSPGACPLAGGIPIYHTDMTLDTTTLCEVTGGPVRTLIQLLSYIAATIIIIRGLSA